MKKGKRRKSNFKLILILLILGITVGYALLTAVLNINGIGRINKATWNIHWENIKVKEGSVSTDNPAIIVDSDRTIVEYGVVFNKPGDYYEFTVDAKNDGTIDGMITSIDNKLYDENDEEVTPLPSYLTYTVTYSDGQEIEENHILKAGRSEEYKVKVKYKETITEDELLENDQVFNFKLSVTYDQSNENGTIRDAICDASIYTGGKLTESRYLDKCEDYIDDSIYTYETNEEDTDTITITGFKDGYTIQQVKSAVRDLRPSKINNINELKIRRVDNKVISFKDNIWAIPSSIDGKKVTKISGDAFSSKDISAMLILPPELIEILDGDSYYDSSVGASITTGAFYKNNITGIAMPQKLTYIGSYAFEENKLTSLVFSDSVGIIGTGALSDMPTLSDVTLGKGLKRIGGGAFYNTNLTSIDFPDGLEAIGGGSFSATKLKKVIIPDSVTTIEGGSFYLNTVEEIVIGDGITGTVPSGAFLLDNVKKIKIGNGITTISGIGSAPKLTSLTLGSSVERITNGSFSGCKLKKLVLPDNVKYVENGAFSGCSEVEEFDTGDGLTAMNSGTFSLPKAKKIRVGDSVTEINALGNTAELEDLYLGKSLKTITNGSFYLCKLTKIEIPDNVTTLNNGSFSGCRGVEEIYTGKNVKVIGSGIFGVSGYNDENNEYHSYNTMDSVKKLVFGENLEVIQDGSFSGGSNLEEIVWNNKITTIISGSFSGTRITRLELPDSVTNVNSGAFGNSQIEYLDTGNGMTTINFGTFGNNPFRTVVFGDSIQEIPSGIFNEKTTLTTVTFGSGLKKIYPVAFAESNISRVDLSNTAIEEIGNDAFMNNNISSLTLGPNLETIYSGAFSGNNISGTLTIPASVKTIGDDSFADNSITGLRLSSGLEYLSGFQGNKIASLSIPATVTEIGPKAFSQNQITGTLSIPASVKTVGASAFYYNKLTGLTLIAGLENVGSQAFCFNQVRSINIPSTVQNLGGGAFAANRANTYIYSRTDGVEDNTSLNSFTGYNVASTLPSTVTKLEDYAYYATFATRINNTSQLTTVGQWSLSNLLVTSLDLSNVTELPNYTCYSNKNMTSVTLGSGLTTIGSNVFASDNLSSITIPANVTSIGLRAFNKTSTSNKNLSTITNTTGRSFNWGRAINGSSGYEFETGTVTNSQGNVTITN